MCLTGFNGRLARVASPDAPHGPGAQTPAGVAALRWRRFAALPLLALLALLAAAPQAGAQDATNVSLELSSASISEAGGTATLTVRLSGRATVSETTVEVTEDPAVYTLDATSKTIPAGSTRVTFTVTAVDDTENPTDAPDVVVTIPVNVFGGDDVVPPDPGSVDLTIRDDEATPRVMLSVSPATINEGNLGNEATVTASLDHASSTSITVAVDAAQSGGAAVNLSDIFIPAGETAGTNTLEFFAEDDEDKTDETVRITGTVTDGTATAPPSVTLRIRDNDRKGVSVSTPTLTVVEGDTATYELKLNTEPSGPVTLTFTAQAGVTVDADSSADGDQASLTVAAQDWDSPFPITVAGTQDPDAGDDTARITHRASGGGYSGSFPAVDVTITDDDLAGITVSPTDLTVNETGEGRYTVRLDTPPSTGSVRVDIASDNADVTVIPAFLTFTASDWYQRKSVTVQAADDDALDDGSATLSHAIDADRTTAPEYDALADLSEDDVTVTVVDNDAAVGATVSKTGLAMREGRTATYTLRLNGTPEENVTIALASDDEAVAMVAPATLTFTPTNWNTAQTVTVTGVQDEDAGDSTATVTHTASSADLAWDNIDLFFQNVAVIVEDDDTAGVTVSGLSRSPIPEGGSATYTVALTRPPTGIVQIDLTLSGDTGFEGVEVDLLSLTFEPDNWSTPQTVTVSAGEDDGDSDNDRATVAHAVNADNSADEYDRVTIRDVSVTVEDNDKPGATVTEVFEPIPEGETTTYEVRLNAPLPEGKVVRLRISSNNPDVTVEPETLDFDEFTWALEQTVTVSAAHDPDAGDDSATVTHRITSGTTAGNYPSNLRLPSVAVTVDDDETAGVTASPTALTVSETGQGRYTVVLDTPPSRDSVVVTVTADNTDVTVSPASLTFTSSTWNTPKQVTVRAKDDTDSDDDTAILTHAIDTGRTTAPEYDALTNLAGANVTVTVTDNDVTGVTVSTTGIALTEGQTKIYTLKLNRQPAANVTITLASDDPALVTVTPATLVFTPSNSSIAQRVTVRGVQDDDAVDGTATISHTAASTGDPAYDGMDLAYADVAVAVDDNEPTPTVTLTVTPATIHEGEVGNAATVTASLNHAWGEDVTVTVSAAPTNSATEAEDFTGGTGDIVIPAGATTSADTVEIFAGTDTDTRHESVRITGTASGGVNAPVAKTLTIRDNGVPGVAVSTPALTVGEGGTATYGLKLHTEPSGNVTLTATPGAGVTVDLEPFVDGDQPSRTLTPTEYLGLSGFVTVTVRGAEDEDAADEAVTIRHRVSGGGYSGSVAAVDVTVVDDETAGVMVSAPNLTVGEGASATYTVVLDTKPSTGSVRIDIASDNDDVTVSPAPLTFTTGNWDTPKTVTVRAAGDADGDDDTATLSHTINTGATGAPEYKALTGLPDVTVTVTDDELAAPANLRLMPLVAGLDVSWDAVRGADGYTVRWKSGSEEFASNRQAAVTGGDTTTHRLTLAQGVAYDVQVRATAVGADGPWSEVATETTLRNVVPNAPALVSVTPGAGDSVTLAWTAPTGGTPPTSYKWQFTPAPSTTSSQWTDGGTGITDLTATGTAAGARTRHTAFRVIGVNAAGDGASSNVITLAGQPGAVGTLVGVGGERIPLPALPDTTIRLTWTAPAASDNGGKPLTGFEHERRAHPSGSWGKRGTVGVGAAQADITGLDADANYDFRVRAANADRGGPWTEVTVSGRPAGPVGVTAVTGFTVSAIGPTSVRLEGWTAPATTGSGAALPAGAPVVEYEYEQRTADTGDWTSNTNDLYTFTGTSVMVTSLREGADLEFRVRARTGQRTGRPSAAVRATPGLPAGTPRDLRLDPPRSNSEAILAWGEPGTGVPSGRISFYYYSYRESGAASYGASQQRIASESGVTLRELSAGTSYDFRVRLCTGPDERTPPQDTDEACGPYAQITFRTTGAPPAPTGLAAVPGAEDGTLDVTWDRVYGAEGYRVQWKRSTDTSYPASNEALLTGDATTSYRITGLAGRTEYTVRVLAYAESQDGAASEAMGTPPLNVAPTVTEIGDRTLPLADGALTIDLAAAFTDDEALTYAAESGDTAVATVAVSGASLTVTPVAPGTAAVTVTATDTRGLTATQTFTVTVQSSNADLSALVLSVGRLATDFAPATTAYTAIVPDTASTIAVTPTTAHAGARVTVNGATVASGSASGAISVGEGTVITVRVTAQDGATKDYTLTVDQQPLWTLKLVRNGQPFSTVAETDADVGYPHSLLHLERGSSTRPMPGSLAVQIGGTADNPEDYVFNQGNQFSGVGRHNDDLASAGRAITIKGDGLEEPNETITFSVTPPDGPALTATLTITDDDEGERPPVVATVLGATAVGLGNTRTIDLAAAFSDPGDTLTFSARSSNTGIATVAVSGTTLTLTPVARGAATIEVTATDSGSRSATQTFTVTVHRSPRFTSGATFSVPENTLEVGQLAAVDDDPEDEVTPGSFGVVRGAEGGPDDALFWVTIDGKLSFLNAPNFESDRSPVYRAKVRVTSGANERAATTTQDVTVTVTDAPGEGPGRPAAPTFGPATAGSLDVRWTAPANPGPAIDDYDLRYQPATADPAVDAQWTNGPQDQTGTSATIGGLAAGTSYRVQVQATSDEGTSDWSPSGEAMTLAAGNADLSALTISAGRLTPDFARATTSYMAIVPDSESSITVTPTAVNPGATVTVNGATVARGSASGPITAGDGAVITVRVAAQDGSTTKDYVLTVDRQPLWTLRLEREGAPFTTVAETDTDVPYGSTFLVLERGSSTATLQASVPVTVGGTANNPADYEFDVADFDLDQENSFPAINLYNADLARGARRVTIKGDDEAEPAETIIFSVTTPDGHTLMATLTITDDDRVNNPPAFASGQPDTLTVAENVALGTDIGSPFTATDDDGDPLTWTVEGADADNFAIDATGQITTARHLDYDEPQLDGRTKSSHAVTVRVSDGVDSTAHNVTVNVTDQDDTGDDKSLTPTAGADPTATRKSRATYSITITGLWTDSVSPGGVPTDSNPHFTHFVGGIHNSKVKFLERGGTASAGVERMAEQGLTADLESEVEAAGANADRAVVFETLDEVGTSTFTKDIDNIPLTLTSDHPRITLTSMIAPSPDWFVGVAGLRLLEDKDNWAASHRVDLYPWDAGTESGAGFSRSNPDGPRGVIRSIRGRGPFSDRPIARFVFTRTAVERAPEAPAGLSASESNAAVVLTWTAPAANSDIDGHEYRQKTTGDYGDWTAIPNSAPGEVHQSGFTVGGLTNGTEYTFQVRAVNDVGGGVPSAEVSATPTAATVSVADATAAEGDGADNGTAVFTVTMGVAQLADVTFDYAASIGADDTADLDADLTGTTSGSGTIAAGETSTEISIAIVQDLIDETDETFTLTLTNLSANAGFAENGATAIGTITDDDDPPSGIELSLDTATLAEAEADAAHDVTVTATVQGGTRFAAAQTVTLTLAGGGTAPATPGTDFTPATATLTIPAGAESATQTIALTVKADELAESAETLHVTGAVTAGATDTTVTTDPDPLAITITDDDALAVSINAADIGDDGVVNITEKAEGFDITGTVTEGSAVSVTLGGGDARAATVTGTTWSLAVPGGDEAVTGTSVAIEVTATQEGFTAGTASGSFDVDLAAPSASWAAPESLTVEVEITAIAPGNPSSDIDSYALVGTLPAGLTFDAASGTISGAPTTATTTPTEVTIRLTDHAGNTADVPLTLPAVVALPSAPTGLTAEAGSGDQILLSWTAPTEGLEPTGYKWEHTSAPATESSSWTEGGILTGIDTSATVTLAGVANAPTAFRVRATSTGGDGSPSNADDVAGAPGAVTALSAMGAVHVTLSWTDAADGGKPVTYRIERRPQTSQEERHWRSEEDNETTGETTWTTTVVSEKSNLSYRVRAENADRVGPWARIAVTGRPAFRGNLGQQPVARKVANQGDRMILAWKVPDSTTPGATNTFGPLPAGGKVVSFLYQWREAGETSWTNEATEARGGRAAGAGVTVTVMGLSAGTDYEFRVRADSSTRLGVFSNTARATTSATARIAATTPATLTESALHGATVTVNLDGTRYRPEPVPTSAFRFSPAVAGLSVSAVQRTSDTRAVLSLAFNGDLTADTGLRVVVGAHAHEGADELTTDPAPVTAMPGGPAWTLKLFAPGTDTEITQLAETDADHTVNVQARLVRGSGAEILPETTALAYGAGGTASRPADYTATLPALARQADGHSAVADIAFVVKGDSADEPDETIVLSATVGGRMFTATLTIADDDATPAMTPGAPGVSITRDTGFDLILTISAPASDGGAAITGYVCENRRLSASTWETNFSGICSVGSSTFRPAFGGLSLEEDSFLRVRARNSAGHGPWTYVRLYAGGSRDNSPPSFSEGSSATRSTPENTPVGGTVGAPVTATDSNVGGAGEVDMLAYSLAGPDAAAFAIDSDTGQIRTRIAFDRTMKIDYAVTVRVVDLFGASDTIPVAITVTEAEPNAAPTITSSATFNAAENQMSAGTVVAEDTDDQDSVTGYEITGGADMGLFDIEATDQNAGALTFKAAPNFEAMGSAAGDNAYRITVTATSGAGNRKLAATQDITVNVTNVPGEAPGIPTSVQATATVNSLTVTWGAPEANPGPALGRYVLQWKGPGEDYPLDSSAARSALITDLDAFTHTIPGLSPQMQYSVRVRAENAEGNSSWVERTVTTTAAVPGAPSITSVTWDGVEFSRDHTVTLSWTTPDTGGAAITGYEWQYRSDRGDEQDWINPISGSPTTQTTVTGVLRLRHPTNVLFDLPFQNYLGHFQVRAMNSVGHGPWSPVYTLHRPPAAPGLTATPGEERQGDGPDTEMDLAWTAPSDNGGSGIASYRYEWRPAGDTTWSHMEALGSASGVTVSGLGRHALHEFRVRARNASRNSGWSDTVTVAGRPHFGGVAPTATAHASRGEVALSWTALTGPATGGKSITSYRYEWRPASSTDDADWQGENTTSAGATVTGLEFGTPYAFRVRASNEDRTGLWSDEAEATTATPTLSIDDPSVAEGDSGAATLTFTVTLAPASEQAVTVDYADANSGTATSGTDYVALTAGTLNFAAGETSKTIAVTVRGDMAAEPDETVVVRLASATGAAIGDGEGVGRITDDDVSQVAGVTVSTEVNGLTVSWTALNGASGYKVQWKSGSADYDPASQDTAAAGEAPVSGGGATTHKITGLTPDTTYTVRVIATFDNRMDGQPSEEATGTPVAAAEVPEAPQILAVEWLGFSINLHEISLSWSAPDDRGADITEYLFSYRSDQFGATEWTDPPVTLTGNPATVLIFASFESRFLEYSNHFRIRARNSVGLGPWSPVYTLYKPPAAPGLTATSGERRQNGGPDTEVDLVWTPPTDTGGSTIERYRYEWRPAGGGAWSGMDTTNSARGETISGLNRFVLHEFRVRGRNANRDGAWRTVTVAGRPNFGGAAPTATAHESRAEVALSWTALTGPATGGKSITSYRYEWRPAISTDDADWQGENTTGAGATVTGLEFGTRYAFRVRASNEDRVGLWSDEAEETTAIETVSVTIDESSIARDGVVNIADKAAGFTITGTVDIGAAVSVDLGAGAVFSATVAPDGAWTASVPADHEAVIGTSVTVEVTATRANFTDGTASGSFDVDLEAPSATWAVPASLTVGEEITPIAPGSPSSDIVEYSATGLPSGLSIHATDGTISGTPTTASTDTSDVTIRLTDDAGNSADVPITFRAVAKGTQTLTGFAYTPATATLGRTPPTVTVPTGLATDSNLSYESSDETVCTVDSESGALKLKGTGTCTITVTASATDDYNEATATFTVTTTAAVPGKPRMLEVTSATDHVTDSSATLSWAKPVSDGGSPITSYEWAVRPASVHDQTHFGCCYLFSGTVGASSTSAYIDFPGGRLDRSQGSVKYFSRFRVRAANAVGSGPWSDALVLHHPPEAPGLTVTAGERRAAGSTLTPTEVDLVWTVPSDSGGSAIAGYRHEWKRSSGSQWAGMDVGAGATSATPALPSYDPEFPHDFRVRARNASRDGDWSATVTLAGRPSFGSAAPTATAHTSRPEVALSWIAPTGSATGGKSITSYRYEWRPASSTDEADWQGEDTADGATTSATVTGLEFGTPYAFRVRASNADRDGSYSPEALATTAVLGLSIDDPTVPEGHSGTVTLTFTVTLSTAVEHEVTVDYEVAGSSTATSNTDYAAVAADTLTFAAGDTTRNIAVTVNGDTVPESAETVVIRLSNAAGATIVDGEGVGQIFDDDSTQVMGLTLAPAIESLDVSWLPISGASGYKVQWKSGDADYDPANQDEAVAGEAILSDGATAMHSISGLTAGTPYTVQVIATYSDLPDGSASEEQTATPLRRPTAPGKPRMLEVTSATDHVTDSSATLSWAKPVSDGGSPITSYEWAVRPASVHDQTHFGCCYLFSGTVGASSTSAYIDFPGGRLDRSQGSVKYFSRFRVRAANAVGSGLWSDALVLHHPPEAPGLTVTAGERRAAGSTLTPTEVDLVWTVPSDSGGSAIAGYRHEWKRSSGSQWAGMDVGAGATSATPALPSYDSEFPHDFRVRARNASRDGDWSATVTLAGRPSFGSAAPTATAHTSRPEVALSWIAPTGSATGGKSITSYRYEWRPASSTDEADWQGEDTADGATASATVTGLEFGTPYAFRVRASNADRDGQWSREAGATTAMGTLSVTIDESAIADDGVVNIAEKAAGFTISGDTGSESGVSVSVTIGSQTLTATSSGAPTAAWSVDVPANAEYITGTSVTVTVSASKAGFTPPSEVTHTLGVDLVAPTAPTYAAPTSLQVGTAIAAISPSATSDSDIARYNATGLPSGLSIEATNGTISGAPDTANASTAAATVTITDDAGNTADVALTFPMVAKGDQTLTGFEYDPASIEFGDAAPTVTAPSGGRTTLAYSATPPSVCTVNASSGVLTIQEAGECVITVTAPGDDNYNEGTATFTLTVQPAGTLALNVAAVAGDDTINIAKRAAGFTISGDTGSESGVSVSVTIGSQTLTATSSGAPTAVWSVDVPANAEYITGTSVTVTVSASKAGFTPPSEVTRTLGVDLVAPTAPTYAAPTSLQVGTAIAAISPSATSDSDIARYNATDLPSGLTIHATNGTISGTPDTANASTAAATVTITDGAGNTADVTITFPAVSKGHQTLTGFTYSSNSIAFNDPAPTVTAPSGGRTTLEYSATPPSVCAVNASSGVLTIQEAGECVITVTAPGDDNYNEGTATFTLTVQPAGALALNVAAVAGDNTINIAERAAGFTISGDTGSESGVSVSVTIGSQTLTATSSGAPTAVWSVDVPANAEYITDTSVTVTVSASKAGFTPPGNVTRALTVDLDAPSAAWAAPASLTVGEEITPIAPVGPSSHIAGYSATGLPSGLTIHATDGTISGTPDTADTDTAEATVTITDDADNTADITITFPAVSKGHQTLTGFTYSSNSIAFNDPAPTVTAPSGARTALEYSAAPPSVCTVNASTGALTVKEAGTCTITVTAPADANYNQATATFTLTVRPAAPTGVGVTAGSGDGFTLSWTAPAGTVASYTWEHTPAPATPQSSWTEGGTGVTGTSATGTVTGLETTTTAFRVRGANAGGNGAWSAPVVLAAKPGQPGSLTVLGYERVAGLSSGFRVAWTAVPTANNGGKPITLYQLERRVHGSGSYTNRQGASRAPGRRTCRAASTPTRATTSGFGGTTRTARANGGCSPSPAGRRRRGTWRRRLRRPRPM